MVISRVIIRVTPFRALNTLLITYFLSPLPLQEVSQTYPGNSRFNLFSVTCNDVDVDSCSWPAAERPKELVTVGGLNNYQYYFGGSLLEVYSIMDSKTLF